MDLCLEYLVWTEHLGLSLFRFTFAGNAGNVAVVVSHLKEGSLLGGVPLQFVQVQFARIAWCSCRLVFALDAAFGLVALFLLARVFFLAFGKA
jgi:hypothetical protein